jgi:Zn finger protein HypA/HybF involved in hydrogenase expression
MNADNDDDDDEVFHDRIKAKCESCKGIYFSATRETTMCPECRSKPQSKAW